MTSPLITLEPIPRPGGQDRYIQVQYDVEWSGEINRRSIRVTNARTGGDITHKFKVQVR